MKPHLASMDDLLRHCAQSFSGQNRLGESARHLSGLVAEEQGRIFLTKKKAGKRNKRRFARVRGSATARVNIEEIMRLT